MGDGIDAVAPIDMGYLECIENLFSYHTGAQNRKMKPMYERLLEAAKYFLNKAGIYFPHANLEIREGVAVLHGVPHCSQLVVCAYNSKKGRIESILGLS